MLVKVKKNVFSSLYVNLIGLYNLQNIGFIYSKRKHDSYYITFPFMKLSLISK